MLYIFNHGYDSEFLIDLMCFLMILRIITHAKVKAVWIAFMNLNSLYDSVSNLIIWLFFIYLRKFL